MGPIIIQCNGWDAIWEIRNDSSKMVCLIKEYKLFYSAIFVLKTRDPWRDSVFQIHMRIHFFAYLFLETIRLYNTISIYNAKLIQVKHYRKHKVQMGGYSTERNVIHLHICPCYWNIQVLWGTQNLEKVLQFWYQFLSLTQKQIKRVHTFL